MPAHEFDYAVIRVVPRVERDEFINAGVILYCRARDFLAATIALDRARLEAFFPPASEQEIEPIERALELFARIAAGDADAGPVARLEQAERFHWLTSPKSTIAQTGPVHSGLCDDPAAMLAHLVDTMVKL